MRVKTWFDFYKM